MNPFTSKGGSRHFSNFTLLQLGAIRTSSSNTVLDHQCLRRPTDGAHEAGPLKKRGGGRLGVDGLASCLLSRGRLGGFRKIFFSNGY